MNKVFSLFFAVAGIFFAVAKGAETTAVPGVINGDDVNVRMAPNVNAPAVALLSKGTRVNIFSIKGYWVEIAAPESLKIYVSEARIGKDGVLTGELNMRTAMDVQSPCLGTLPKGTKVETIDERRYGWVRIKPPVNVNIKLYVASFLVDFDSSKFDGKGNLAGAAAPAAAEKPAEKPAETPAAAEKPAEKPAETPAAAEKPAEKPAETPAAKEEKAELEGVLIKWKYAVSKETGYAVLSGAEGFNKGFVFSDDEALLAAHAEKKVRITGTKAGKFGENGVIILKAESITVL